MMNDGDDVRDKGASRRDVLKLSGATALGAAAFFAAASAVEDSPAGATGTTHVPTSVSMTLGGKLISRVSQVTPLAVLPVVTTLGSTGQAVNQRAYPGYSTVGVTRTWKGDRTFQTWFAQAQTGSDAPQSVTLVVKGRKGSSVSQLTLDDARPLSYEGPKYDQSTPNALATETITLIADSWTFS